MPTYTEQVHYISDRDLASRYRISRSTVWRWAKEGRLPEPIRFSPCVTRWSLSDIIVFEEKLSISTSES